MVYKKNFKSLQELLDHIDPEVPYEVVRETPLQKAEYTKEKYFDAGGEFAGRRHVTIAGKPAIVEYYINYYPGSGRLNWGKITIYLEA